MQLGGVERKSAVLADSRATHTRANLGIEFYKSNQAGSSDSLGIAGKFSVPLVANGKVFVGAASQLVVYGLRP
jgi:hypothetical protein